MASDLRKFIGRRIGEERTSPEFFANNSPIGPGERFPTVVDLGAGYFYACPAGWNASPEQHTELVAYAQTLPGNTPPAAVEEVAESAAPAEEARVIKKKS